MQKISIDFLPEGDLVAFLQGQCPLQADGERGAFCSALDTDVSHLGAHAALEQICVTSVVTEPHGMWVCYGLHYRIFNGCAGVDLQGQLDKKVFGRKAENGWEFDAFAMPQERSTADEF